MVEEIKEGKNRNSKRTNSDMMMTTKEKRLANTDIEISQHALVTFKFDLTLWS